MTMNDFRVSQITDGAYSILDKGNCSFYVVEGKEKAAVIDTGITRGGKILPVVRALTQKPLVLVITHAHIDHLHHMDEFEEVYLCHEDLTKLPPKHLENMKGGKPLDFEATHDMRTGTVIGLGDCDLEICQVPGHTPGSVVILDTSRDLLFTGDAIGSGYGVWMQVPGAVPLEEYRDHLQFLLKWLLDRGGRMQFWGGHNNQQYESGLIPQYNPLSIGLLADLIDLVDGIVRGTITGRPSSANAVLSLEPTQYASFGRAEIQYLVSNVHCKKEPAAEK